MPGGDPAYFQPIPYITRECNKCNKWGHRQFYCWFMTKYFPEITDSYDKLKVRNGTNSINNINTRESSDDESSENDNKGTYKRQQDPRSSQKKSNKCKSN